MTRTIVLAERMNPRSRDGEVANATARMRQRKRARARVETARVDKEPAITMASPPPRARPTGLQTSRATLFRCLATRPTISRSVGLVR
jgi:hypothetical protein